MSSVQQRQLNIFTRRSPRQEIKVLENKADFTVTNIGELIPIQMGDITTIKQVASTRRPVQTANDIHQR